MVLPFPNSLPSSHSFPPFYSDILESQGNYWFPCFALWSPQYVLCLLPSRSSFPFLHAFLLFSFVSLKVHGWLLISKHAEVTPFLIQILAVLLLHLFSQTGGIPFCRFESLPLLLLHSDSPRCYPLVLWEVADSSFFSCWVVRRLRRTWLLLCSLCFFFFFVFFFWTVLICRWLCLYA